MMTAKFIKPKLNMDDVEISEKSEGLIRKAAFIVVKELYDAISVDDLAVDLAYEKSGIGIDVYERNAFNVLFRFRLSKLIDEFIRDNILDKTMDELSGRLGHGEKVKTELRALSDKIDAAMAKAKQENE